jgi:hypothetical protein
MAVYRQATSRSSTAAQSANTSTSNSFGLGTGPGDYAAQRQLDQRVLPNKQQIVHPSQPQGDGAPAKPRQGGKDRPAREPNSGSRKITHG